MLANDPAWSHLLLRGRVTKPPGIRCYGWCLVLPSAPRLSSRSMDRDLQAVGLYLVPSLWVVLRGLLLHRQLSITASDFSIKFHWRFFGGFSPAYSSLK